MATEPNDVLIDAWVFAQAAEDTNRRYWAGQKIKNRLSSYGEVTPEDVKMVLGWASVQFNDGMAAWAEAKLATMREANDE